MSQSKPAGAPPSANSKNRQLLGITVFALRAIAGTIAWRGTPRHDSAQLTVADQKIPVMTAFKSPSCVCCGKWIHEMRESGVKIDVVDQIDVTPTKHQLGVPDEAMSWHTAKIGSYVIEGHVPAADVMRLLAEHPDVDVVGIAAPGMPSGAPGMENGTRDHDAVVSFDRVGAMSPFASD
jgi:hypothetical protein